MERGQLLGPYLYRNSSVAGVVSIWSGVSFCFSICVERGQLLGQHLCGEGSADGVIVV